jgi:glutamate formiminotransferase/formiminotetrahydrofolate cyclodeaminase
MTQSLVECIPNFSEGRRPEVVQAIADAIHSVPGVHILDRHSDQDHNRSVITFVAAPEAAKQAAFAGIAKAAELIDLNQHEGEHPRIGAADVVPFVPIRDVSMDECVELARALGKRVGSELGVPVYLYERAATSPARVNLEDVRRGEYETLKAEIADNPERAPDYGPRALGPAGATVIGARPPLIAYNIYLTTDDASIAKSIARAIRHSSGGLRYVKSIGLLVDGRAQVSMNLTDYRRSPLARVTEMVRREARRYGVSLHHAELVGLAPEQALVEAARWYLQLDQFEPDQVLETRLFEAAGGGGPEERFLDRLAAGSATPGGGAAAAHVGAAASALVAMVARLTAGKKKYADVESRMDEIAGQADSLRADLEAAVERDSAAFEQVMAALGMPKGSEQEAAARQQALERAMHGAAEVPLEVASWSCIVLELAAEVARAGNANAITDAASAAEMAMAALHSAGLNVRINAASARDQQAVVRWKQDLEALERRAAEAMEAVRAALRERAKLEMR